MRGAFAAGTVGAIAKYLASDAENASADAAIRALGGYGYTHEYLVEDPEMTIAPNRWPAHPKTRS